MEVGYLKPTSSLQNYTLKGPFLQFRNPDKNGCRFPVSSFRFLNGYRRTGKGQPVARNFGLINNPPMTKIKKTLETPAKLLKTGEIVIPGNPGEGRGRPGIQGFQEGQLPLTSRASLLAERWGCSFPSR
jgi:hypothetical protein